MLPVVHSILDAESLCRQIVARYQIGAYEQALLWRPFINDVYRLDAGGRRWWLRVHATGWRSPDETQAEIDALLAIAQVDDLVVRPVRLTSGGYVSTVSAPEGERGVVLFEDAPGAELRFFGEDGELNARRYGEAEARLHSAFRAVPAFTARPPFDVETVVTSPAAIVAAELSVAEMRDFQRIVGRLREAIQSRPNLTVGFCHGDLNSENIHFEGARARAIDFDLCGFGLRAFELAGFAHGVAWVSRDVADRLICAFLEGYHQSGSTTKDDLGVLPAMLLARRIWVGAIHLTGASRWGALGFGRAYVVKLLDWLGEWESVLDTAPSWARYR